MGPKRREPRREVPAAQLSFLAPEDAVLLQLARQNLQVLADLRSRYHAGGPVADADRPQVRSPGDVVALLGPEMAPLLQEQLRVLLLDTRHRVLRMVLLYQGNIQSAVVRQAEVFREAIVEGAPALILVHNHPSGDPEPSPDDVIVTQEAVRAGALLDIDVLDHVVIGHGRFVSLRERRLFTPADRRGV